MFVTYTPDKGDALEFTVYPAEMRFSEQEAVEKASGMEFSAWTLAVQTGSARARRVLLWVLMRREHPKLLLGDVDFSPRELLIETSAEEKRALLDFSLTKGALPPDALAAAEAEIEASRSDPDLVGKALLPIVV